MLPADVGAMRSIEQLVCTSNRIKRLPEFTDGHMRCAGGAAAREGEVSRPSPPPPPRNLKGLAINDNSLSELSESFCKLVHVTNMDIADNKLTRLPDGT